MLRLNIRRPKLAGFIARKENNASGLLRITFKHIALPPDLSQDRQAQLRGLRPPKTHNPDVAIRGPRPHSKDIVTFALLFELPRFPRPAPPCNSLQLHVFPIAVSATYIPSRRSPNVNRLNVLYP